MKYVHPKVEFHIFIIDSIDSGCSSFLRGLSFVLTYTAKTESHGSYRAALKQIGEEHPEYPVIPYFALFLSDIAQVESRNETYMTSHTPMTPSDANTFTILQGHSASIKHNILNMPVVNLGKFRIISLILKEFSDLQSRKAFEFAKDEHMQTFIQKEFISIGERGLYLLSNMCQVPEE